MTTNGGTTTNGRHTDGNKKYGRCNIAEDHALNNPGHSVSVIQDITTKEDGSPGTMLRVWCIGTPEAFMNDKRDCEFVEEIDLP